MSAYMVSKAHIDLLVSAAIHHAVPVRLAATSEEVVASSGSATDIGRMLWAENVRSLDWRYPHHAKNHEKYLREVAAYEFTPCPPLTLTAIAQALADYDYQACECPDYGETIAKLFVANFEKKLGKPEGSNLEPWGFE